MQASDEFRLVPPGETDTGLVRLPAALFEAPAEIYKRVYRVLKPRTAVPEVVIRFEKFAGVNSSICLRDGKLLVRISDMLDGAPASVHEALAFILLCKLLRREIPRAFSHRYRLFLNRRDMRNRALIARQERGRKLHLGAKGEFHDLEKIFEELNRVYFQGLMARPALGWSLRRSRTRLGHFDPSHNAIVISRIFDQPHLDSVVLEYVMFHEMLHLRFPVEHRGARR